MDSTNVVHDDVPVANDGLYNHCFRRVAYYDQYFLINDFLSNPNVNPNCLKGYPLYISCEKGHIRTVIKLLADKRLKPQISHLLIAWENYHTEIVDALLNDDRILNIITPEEKDKFLTPKAKPIISDRRNRRNRRNRRIYSKLINNYPHYQYGNKLHDSDSDIYGNDSINSDSDKILITSEDNTIEDKNNELLPTYELNHIEELFKNAILAHNINTLKYLINIKNVDPCFNNNYPIRLAAHNSCLEVVDFLLQYSNVDPSDLDNQAIINAYDNKNTKIIKILSKDDRVREKLLKNYHNNKNIINLSQKDDYYGIEA